MAELTTTLYELNKTNMLQIEPLNEVELDNAILKMSKELINHNYLMMLSNELKDYTVFKIKNSNYPTITNNIKKIILSRGIPLDITEQPNKAWEIWVKNKNAEKEDEAYLYMMFDYDWGIVDCKEAL